MSSQPTPSAQNSQAAGHQPSAQSPLPRSKRAGAMAVRVLKALAATAAALAASAVLASGIWEVVDYTPEFHVEILETATLSPIFSGQPSSPVSGDTSLLAGAGKSQITPVPGIDKAGYPPRRHDAEGVDFPLNARALVLKSPDGILALVSLDLLEAPQALAEEIAKRAKALGIPHVLVAATHVHSSVGGYDGNIAAQFAATGMYSGRQFDAVAQAAADALKGAMDTLRPARFGMGNVGISGLSVNRAEKGGPVDDRLGVLAIDGAADGRPIATLFSMAGHATLVPRRSRLLDADYPGRTAQMVEEATGGAVALFFQAAAGDARASLPEASKEAMERLRSASGIQPRPGDNANLMARLLFPKVMEARNSASSSPLPPSRITFARARFALPAPRPPSTVPGVLQGASSVILSIIMPRSALASVVMVEGTETFLFLPVEPTWFMAKSLKDALARSEPIRLVELTDGYVGYGESDARRREGLGESKRSLWSPDMEARIGDAARNLIRAAEMQMERHQPAPMADGGEDGRE